MDEAAIVNHLEMLAYALDSASSAIEDGDAEQAASEISDAELHLDMLRGFIFNRPRRPQRKPKHKARMKVKK